MKILSAIERFERSFFSMRSLVLLLIPLAANAVTPRSAGVTYYRDVLPILQKRCQLCHRPGEAGTGSFLTYETTRPWAQAIKTNVLTRKMPPWFANPEYGHFLNERRLSDTEIQTLVAWADAGAPEGDPKDKPSRVKWNSGWNISPDAVFETKDIPVPAKGVLDYVYIVIPTNSENDMWITGGEIRPSDRSVVHHVSAFWRPPGSKWLKDARPFVPYTIPRSDAEKETGLTPVREGSPPRMVEEGAEFLIGYSPGMPPQDFSLDHAAKLIPAESDLVLEVHFTPNGKTPVEERIQTGFVFAKVEPTRRFLTVSDWSWKISIPPGDANYEGHASMRFNEAVNLVFMQPHMHLRGKDMTVRLVYPDGKSEIVLDVPHYEFNWQIIYYEAQPLHIPKGTRMEITAHWDNSANNPFNPDPAAQVHLGAQNTDEMLVCHTGFTVERRSYTPNLVTIESAYK
jgi:hypothetical protein